MNFFYELTDARAADPFQNNTNQKKTKGAYIYEELCELSAEELLDLFIQNGLVINDELKQSYTEEELQSLFKEHFSMWHTGISAFNDTMYIDLAEQTKMVYESIVE